MFLFVLALFSSFLAHLCNVCKQFSLCLQRWPRREQVVPRPLSSWFEIARHKSTYQEFTAVFVLFYTRSIHFVAVGALPAFDEASCHEKNNTPLRPESWCARFSGLSHKKIRSKHWRPQVSPLPCAPYRSDGRRRSLWLYLSTLTNLLLYPGCCGELDIFR